MKRIKFILPLFSIFIVSTAFLPQIDGIAGKWTTNLVLPTKDSLSVLYDLKTEKNKLSGFMIQGGTVDPLQDGVINPDSTLQFYVKAGDRLIFNHGKYFGDSITLDLKVHDYKFHLKLLRKR
jgi:hypothetical protein